MVLGAEISVEKPQRYSEMAGRELRGPGCFSGTLGKTHGCPCRPPVGRGGKEEQDFASTRRCFAVAHGVWRWRTSQGQITILL